MDPQTLKAYDPQAQQFTDDWHAQPAATDLHDAVRRYFLPGPTSDVGCGSGRDTAWLSANGFPAVGFDPSEALLAEARRRYPEVRFQLAALPELDGVAVGSFKNVLCEPVIMHLEAAQIGSAVRKLPAILQNGGILYLTWRVTENIDRRDEHGRLYSAFDPRSVLEALSCAEVLSTRRKPAHRRHGAC